MRVDTYRRLFIWPFLVGLGRMLLPTLIRTATPIVATGIINRFAPPTAPQRAATYDEEEFEEIEEEEEEE